MPTETYTHTKLYIIKKVRKNKKHAENADTSTSVTFDFVVWPWPFVKVKKADVIRCHLLYGYLIPGMMSMGFIALRDITICLFYVTFDLHLWPSSSVKVTFIFIIRWTLYCCVLVPRTKFIGSVEFEILTIVCRKLKWRHNDVISHSNYMKFKHKATKGISKQHTEFHFDQTSKSWDTR